MEESSYKHNYEYLSIEEAKAIINGTFVQGTTNIGGELATKADIDKLLIAADKKLTSIVPSTEVSNEFVCFFECVDNRVDPTGVHVTNIIIQVGRNQKIKYELTPSNATVDTCTYEITSGSEYIHITDGIVYADAVGEATCKITINGTIESTFIVSIINGQAEQMSGDVFIIQKPLNGSSVYVDFHSQEYCFDPSERYPQYNNYMVYPRVFVQGLDWGIFQQYPQIIIDVDAIRKTYKSIKSKPSLIKGKTIEQACQIHDGHYVYVYLYSDDRIVDSYIGTIYTQKARGYKKSSGSSISLNYDGRLNAKLNGYTATGDFKDIKQLVYGTILDSNMFGPEYEDTYKYISCYKDVGDHHNQKGLGYFTHTGTLFSFIMIDLDSNEETPVFNFVSFNDGYFDKGYHLLPSDESNLNIRDIAKDLSVDITTNSQDIDGDNVKLNITINKINNSEDISSLRAIMFSSSYKNGSDDALNTLVASDNNGAFFWHDHNIELPYTTQINIPKKDYDKVCLYMVAFDTKDSSIYRTSTPIKEVIINGSTQ